MADTEDGSNYLKAYILLMYYIVVGLLAVVGNLSANADMKPILSMLTPHLLYIPLVLTALWYPKEKFIHISIFIVFICLLQYPIVRRPLPEFAPDVDGEAFHLGGAEIIRLVSARIL